MKNLSLHALLITITLLSLSSCNKGLQKEKVYESSYFTIQNTDDCSTEILQGFDSAVGRVTCGDIIMMYDYGHYSDKGPESSKIFFRRTFDSYYYSQFFEKMHVDPKVFKLFKDSVEILKILPSGTVSNEDYIKKCDPCNVVAKLKFKNYISFFPFNIDQNTLENNRNFEISEKEIDGIYYKKYVSKNGVNSGIYCSSNEVTDGFINGLSVIVIAGKDRRKIDKILSGIRSRQKANY